MQKVPKTYRWFFFIFRQHSRGQIWNFGQHRTTAAV